MRGVTGHPATASRSCAATWGTVGITRSIGPACAARRAIVSPKMPARRRISFDRLPGSASTSGGSAKRRRASSAFGPQLAEALDERMADIAARRPAQLGMDGRLERQDGHHPIDVAAHSARPARPPRPNRRRNVVDNRNRRRQTSHPARHPMGEIRAVDNDKRVRSRGDDCKRGFTDAAKNLRQPLWDRRSAR